VQIKWDYKKKLCGLDVMSQSGCPHCSRVHELSVVAVVGVLSVGNDPGCEDGHVSVRPWVVRVCATDAV
jgi:hypothetical protein